MSEQTRNDARRAAQGRRSSTSGSSSALLMGIYGVILLVDRVLHQQRPADARPTGSTSTSCGGIGMIVVAVGVRALGAARPIVVPAHVRARTTIRPRRVNVPVEGASIVLRTSARARSRARRRLVVVVGASVIVLVAVVVIDGGGRAPSPGVAWPTSPASGPVVVVPGYGGSAERPRTDRGAGSGATGATVVGFQPTQGGTGDLRVQAKRLAAARSRVIRRSGPTRSTSSATRRGA